MRGYLQGTKKTSDLIVNKKLGYDEAKATPEQMLEYLLNKFAINKEGTTIYDDYRAYQISGSDMPYIRIPIRNILLPMWLRMFLMRHHGCEDTYTFQGVEVKEDTKRVYNYPEYFSHIIGYTGKISTEEYEELSKDDDSYTLNDTVGKSGIESSMETSLQGKKGSETVYVNNLGKILEVKDYKEPSAGNNTYLSIDAKLQMAVYDLLEQELAGILYTKIINAKTDNGGDNISRFMTCTML
ncbi:MAG: hypothetical protein V8R80_11080 [Eubacterium sp.]